MYCDLTAEEFDLDSAAAYDQWMAHQEAEWDGVHEQIEAERAAGIEPTQPMYELLPVRDASGRWVWAAQEIT